MIESVVLSTPEVSERVIAVVDEFLERVNGRDMFYAKEVIDVFLDIRNACQDPTT